MLVSLSTFQLAQPIRLLLEQSGVEWQDKLYSCGGPPDYDKTVWFGEKETLGLDFPNVKFKTAVKSLLGIDFKMFVDI